MDIILIKTDQPKIEIYLYKDYECINSVSWQSIMTLNEKLNKTIRQLLASQNLNYNDLDAVIVFAGPGSFTGLRIGHAVANAMAYGLSIPIVSTSGSKWIEKGLNLIIDKHHDDQIVVPLYGSEAHITQAKK